VTVTFTREHLEFLMMKTSTNDPDEALEIYAAAIKKEGVDPTKMIVYLKRLMEMEGSVK